MLSGNELSGRAEIKVQVKGDGTDRINATFTIGRFREASFIGDGEDGQRGGGIFPPQGLLQRRFIFLIAIAGEQHVAVALTKAPDLAVVGIYRESDFWHRDEFDQRVLLPAGDTQRAGEKVTVT